MQVLTAADVSTYDELRKYLRLASKLIANFHKPSLWTFTLLNSALPPLL